MNENGLKNHLIHAVCCWQAWERPPGVDESSGSPGEVFPDPVNNHCSCFCLHTGWTLFFQLSLPSFTWNDLPSPHSYPKCCEHFGRKCRGNVKHYFRNKISVAAKLLQSTASVRDISATSVFVCGRHTLFIIQDESPHKGA